MRQTGPAFSLGRSPSTHTWTVACNHTVIRNSDGCYIAQIPLASYTSSRYDTTRTTCRACRDERVELCLFQLGRRRRSSRARMYKFSLLCSGFASTSEATSEKSEVDMSTPVHAVATPLNTCRASRTCRDVRVTPCCPTSATQHVTTFSCAKMHPWDR